MKVDAGLITANLEDAPKRARELEELGYDGLITAETAHDPFFPLLLAAGATQRIELMTSIAVAFARTPMILANVGHDLNHYSKGRFVMGLGSQIQPHITKRFSMPWSHPARRMREFILAMRAIWGSWYEGKKLDFRGEFYTHTLMTPFFDPGPNPYGCPRIFLAGVGPRMTEVAGEVADGLIAHAFTTEKYLREVTLPALERGLAKSGRRRADFQISYPVFVVTGKDEKEYVASRTGVSRQIAFYGSTPAYKPVLDAHGWGGLQSELNVLSKQGKWEEMGKLISDDILEAFAVIAEPDQVVSRLKARLGGVIDRVAVTFAMGGKKSPRDLIAELRAA